MEQLIYIENEDKQSASVSAKGFALEEVYSRAYINSLATELAMKYLALDNISVSNIYNMHNIRKIHEEFDLADVMLPNVRLDIRMVYDENFIFIPKSHFEYNLLPDIYLVFKMAPDTTHVKFLGFFEPKLINKNNQNSEYYFIEKEKLSNPQDLKSCIENFDNNTTQSLSEEEMDNAHKLAMELIDNNITDEDKHTLINLLAKSADLRRDLAEFDNFEWISYNVVNDTDMPLPVTEPQNTDANLAQEALNIPDEFSVFDNAQAEEVKVEDETSTSEENPNIESENTVETENQIPVENLDVEQDDFASIEDVLSVDSATDESANDLNDFETSSINDFVDEVKSENPISFTDLENSGDNVKLPIDDMELDNGISQAVNLDALASAGTVMAQEALTEGVSDLLSEDSSDVADDKLLELDETTTLPEDTIINSDYVSDENVYEGIKDFDTLSEEPLENPIDTVTDEDLQFTDDLISLDENSEIVEEQTSDIPNDLETAKDDDIFSDELLTQDELNINESEPLAEVGFENADTSDLTNTETDSISLEDFENFGNSDNITEANSSGGIDESLTQTFEEQPESESIESQIDDVQPIGEFPRENTEAEVLQVSDMTPNVSPADIKNVSDPLSIEDLFDENRKPFEELDNLQEEDEPVVYVNSTVITNNDGSVGEIPIDINMFHQEISNEDLDQINETYNQMLQADSKSAKKNNGLILTFAVIIAALAGVLAFVTINKAHVKNANSVEVTDNKTASAVPEELPSSFTPESISENTPLPDISSEAPQIEPDETLPSPPESKAKVEDKSKKASTPQKIQKIDVPYLEVKSVNWSVPKYVSANQNFSSYINSVTKSIKTRLTTELLLVTEYAYTNEFRIDIVLNKDGTLKDAHTSKSSGSKQIDEVVLQTVKQTFNVMKVPSGIIIGDDLHLVLKLFI